MYSIDLRQRVLEFIQQGESVKEACRVYRVSRAVIYQWKQRQQRGQLQSKLNPTRQRKLDKTAVIAYIEAYPDKYLKEIAKEFNVVSSSIYKFCRKCGITLKKSTRYKERNEAQRARFTQELKELDPAHLIVYVDESGFDNRLYRPLCKGSSRTSRLCRYNRQYN